MICIDMRTIRIEGKGTYENCLDEDGKELEWLNGAALTDGCYCKHYTKARNWSDKSTFQDEGKPALQHYCRKHECFMGFSGCCWTNGKCFEKGKSAGVQRIRNRIAKERGIVRSVTHEDHR